MDFEQRLEALARDVAILKNELGRARAELRSALKLLAEFAGHNGSATPGSERDDLEIWGVQLRGLAEQHSKAQRNGVGIAPRKAHSRTVTAYPSDVTDREWRLVEPFVPRSKTGGRPCKYSRREILNGILYQQWSGCPWRTLPPDLPPWKITHYYYRLWRKSDAWDSISMVLAECGKASCSYIEATDEALPGIVRIYPKAWQIDGA